MDECYAMIRIELRLTESIMPTFSFFFFFFYKQKSSFYKSQIFFSLSCSHDTTKIIQNKKKQTNKN